MRGTRVHYRLHADCYMGNVDLHSTGSACVVNFLRVRRERSTMDSVVASEAIDLGSIPSARTSLAVPLQSEVTTA
jgi:hypothetical protein